MKDFTFDCFTNTYNSTVVGQIKELELIQTIRNKSGNIAADLQDWVAKHGKDDIYKNSKKELVGQVCIGSSFEPGTTRTKKNVIGLTGLFAFDIDNIPAEKVDEVKAQIIKNPHTRACYKSVSGLGLQGWVAYEGDYKLAMKTFWSQFDLEFDPAFLNSTLPSNISYDPKAFYRTDAEVITVDSFLHIIETKVFSNFVSTAETIDIQGVYDLATQEQENKSGNRHNFAILLAPKLIAFAIELEEIQTFNLLTDYQKDKIEELYNNSDWRNDGTWGSAYRNKNSHIDADIELSLEKLDKNLLQKLIAENGANLVFIESPMGTGKTTVARSFIKDRPTLAITNSRALNVENAANLGLDLYSEVENSQDYKLVGLTTTLDSLIKFPTELVKDANNALVFVDEISSVQDYLYFSSTLADRRLSVRQAFNTAIYHSELTLMTDARITPEVVETYKQAFPDKKVLVIRNSQPPAKTEATVYQNISLPDFLETIKTQLLGNASFFATDSCEATYQINDFIQLEKCGAKILIVNGDTSGSPEIVAALKDFDKAIQNYDYVIYSPSITGGLDASTAGHFNACFQYNEGRSCSLDSLMQQIGRLRPDVPLFVGISGGHYRNLVTDPEVLEARLDIKNSLNQQKLGLNLDYDIRKAAYELDEDSTLFLKSRFEREAKQNKDLNRLPWSLPERLHNVYKTVIVIDKESDLIVRAEEETKNLMSALKKARKKSKGSEAIFEAKTLSETELELALEKDSNTTTLDEKLEIQKALFSKHLGRDCTFEELDWFYKVCKLDYKKLKAIEKLHLGDFSAEEEVNFIADRDFVNAEANLLNSLYGSFASKSEGSEILPEEINEIQELYLELEEEVAAILEVDTELSKTKILNNIGFSVYRKSVKVGGKVTKVDVVDRKALDSILFAIQNRPKTQNTFSFAEYVSGTLSKTDFLVEI